MLLFFNTRILSKLDFLNFIIIADGIWYVLKLSCVARAVSLEVLGEIQTSSRRLHKFITFTMFSSSLCVYLPTALHDFRRGTIFDVVDYVDIAEFGVDKDVIIDITIRDYASI